MPRFAYQARDPSGKLVRGIEIADHEGALDASLSEMNLCLIDARPERSRRGARVDGRTLIDFCYHLRTVVEGGIPLIDGLRDFCDDESHPLHDVIVDVARKLRNGSQLSEAMDDYPASFPALMRALVRAGEETGRLDSVLRDLVAYLEWRDDLRHKIQSALAYPAVVTVGILGLCVIMLTYVLPSFLEVFQELGVELSLVTRVLIATSQFLRESGLALLASGVGLGIGFALVLRHSTGRRIVDTIVLRLPLLGKLVTMLEMSRFAHNLAILYASGVPAVRAMELIQNIIQNLRIRALLHDATDALRRGGSLTGALDRESLLPRLVLRMISIGEQSGELDRSLERVSAYYDRELPRLIDKALAVFNVATVVTLGGIIGTMALSIFIPVYQMLGSINA